jgi:predicted O-methyltransferase YrrM
MSLTSAQNLRLKKLFDASMKRFEQHRNGAYPYEDYELLFNLVQVHKPKVILEAGTGYGLSTIVLALGGEHTQVISLDKNNDVLDVARQNADDFGLANQIQLIQTTFLDYLEYVSDSTYDMVFFDGFAPGLKIFLELERVLKPGGIMVCANLKLRGDRRKITLRMNDTNYYTHFRDHGDTVVGQKS